MWEREYARSVRLLMRTPAKLVPGRRSRCQGHFERNHKVVHRAVAEFLTKGTVNGRQGLVTVDREGKYLQ